MTCQEYLSRHSEYLDGRLAEEVEARFRAHTEACASCRRYDEVLERSLPLLRALPGVEPSDDFAERLNHRLLHLQDEISRHDRFAGTGAFASLTIAAMIALVAWGPVMFGQSAAARADRGPGVEAQTATVERASLGDHPADWFGQPSLYDARMTGAESLSAAFPGPYSPLIVEPPVMGSSSRTARAVFAAYYPTLE